MQKDYYHDSTKAITELIYVFPHSLQVNNLSPALISLLLLPTMLSTAETHGTTPRLVVVGSAVHSRAKFAQEIIASEHPLRKYNAQEHYKAM